MTTDIREVLLAVELDGEIQGWDSPSGNPAMFEIRLSEETGHLYWDFPQPPNDVLEGLCCGEGYAVGAAMQELARMSEGARAHMEDCRKLDALDKLGRGLVGMGMRMEGKRLELAPSELSSIRSEEDLLNHPALRESRSILFYTVAGIGWSVTRDKGAPVEVVETTDLSGQLPNGITRMLNTLHPGVPIASEDMS